MNCPDWVLWKASKHLCLRLESVWCVTGQGWGLARAGNVATGDWGCCLGPCDPGECQPWPHWRLAECLLSVTRPSSQPSGQGTSSAQATRDTHTLARHNTHCDPPQTTFNLHWWHVSDHRVRSIGLDQWSGKWPRDLRPSSHVSLTPRRSCEKTWQWFSVEFYWARCQSVDCVGNKGNYLIHNRAVMRAWVGIGRAHQNTWGEVDISIIPGPALSHIKTHQHWYKHRKVWVSDSFVTVRISPICEHNWLKITAQWLAGNKEFK